MKLSTKILCESHLIASGGRMYETKHLEDTVLSENVVGEKAHCICLKHERVSHNITSLIIPAFWRGKDIEKVPQYLS